MPIFDAQYQAEQGLNLRTFDGFSRDWFPVQPTQAGVLTTTEMWPRGQLSAVDAVQRALTTNLALGPGIPFMAGQVASQTKLLQSAPALQASSAIAQEFSRALGRGSVPDAIKAALSIVNELGFDALQGAVAAARAVSGLVETVPLIGALVGLGQAYGSLLWETLKPRNYKALRVTAPGYDPDNDFNAASVAHAISSTRDWTAAFSPGPRDLQVATPGLTFTSLGTTVAPTFAGRRTEQDGLWIFGQWGGSFGESLRVLPGTADHWGFVPLRDGYGGTLWRGVMIDRKKNLRTTLVGDSLPTASSLGLGMWQAVQNPYAPQIFFVDAVELENRWINYLIALRRGLHVSHTKEAFELLKGLSGTTIHGDGPMQARLQLSFSNVEGGDLYKQRELRRAACDALVPLFGWKRWQGAREDALVERRDKVEAHSDDFYRELAGIDTAGPVTACRDLFRRQVQAVQTVTVLYSEAGDPAFRTHAGLRNLRNRTVQRAIGVPGFMGAVDSDMVPRETKILAIGQLFDPNSVTVAFDPARKSQTFKIADLWVGDGGAPSRWDGQDRTTQLRVAQFTGTVPGAASGGGVGALALLAAGGAGAYYLMKGR